MSRSRWQSWIKAALWCRVCHQLHSCKVAVVWWKKEAPPPGGGIFRHHVTHVQQTKCFLLHCWRCREGPTDMYFIAEQRLYRTGWVKATLWSFSTFDWDEFESEQRSWCSCWDTSLGLLRKCWLKCKQEYSHSCSASKHCVWNDVLIRVCTLIRVCSAQKRCQWIVKNYFKTVQCCVK